MTDTPARPKYLAGGKRLAVEASEWLPGWHVSASPRNSNSHAEAQWCQWVHLARLILADPYTVATVPDLAVPYPDPPQLYAGCHPLCSGCGEGDEREDDR